MRMRISKLDLGLTTDFPICPIGRSLITMSPFQSVATTTAWRQTSRHCPSKEQIRGPALETQRDQTHFHTEAVDWTGHWKPGKWISQLFKELFSLISCYLRGICPGRQTTWELDLTIAFIIQNLMYTYFGRFSLLAWSTCSRFPRSTLRLYLFPERSTFSGGPNLFGFFASNEAHFSINSKGSAKTSFQYLSLRSTKLFITKCSPVY